MLHNFTLLANGLDVAPLLAEINANRSLWREETARQDYPGSAHKYTEAIFLRWCKGKSVEAAFHEIEAFDCHAMDVFTSTHALIDQASARVGAWEVGRVLLVSLEPGAVIYPHSDEGVYADYYERFHICLQSEEGNAFLTETAADRGEYVHMKPGELWFFNHKAKHMLMNASKKPRIHLIVDLVAPDFRRERNEVPA